MDKLHLKIVGYVVLAILILNLVLFSFRVINWKVFWAVIALGAVLVYWELPKMKEK